MKYLAIILFVTSAFAQCYSLPGGAVCSKGTPCTQAQQPGTCQNTAKPGARPQCGCVVTPNPVTQIPVDQYWELSFHDLNVITTPQASISKTLDFVPADDGLLTFAPLTMQYPNASQGWAGYLFRNTGHFALPMGGTLTMTVRVDASPDAEFDYHSEPENTCPGVATIRPFISFYQIPDAWYYATGRWWSNPISQQIEPGTFTFTVPIDAAHWTGVYGQPGTDPDFAATLASVKSIGIANGGGCFFTHGVQMAAGTASLSVLSVSYQANSAPQVHTGPQ